MSSVKKNIKIHSVEIKRKASSGVNSKKVKKMKTKEPAVSSSAIASPSAAATPPPPQQQQFCPMPDLYSELEDFINMEMQPQFERNAQMPTMEEEENEQRKEEEEALQIQKGINEMLKKIDLMSSSVVDPNFVLPVRKFTTDSKKCVARYFQPLNDDGSKTIYIGLNPHAKFTPIVEIRKKTGGKIEVCDFNMFLTELEKLSSNLVNTKKCAGVDMIQFKSGDVSLFSKDCGISLNRKEVLALFNARDYVLGKLNTIIYYYNNLNQEYYKLLQNIALENMINGKCCIREFLNKNMNNYYYIDVFWEMVKKFPTKLNYDIAVVIRFNRKTNKRIA